MNDQGNFGYSFFVTRYSSYSRLYGSGIYSNKEGNSPQNNLSPKFNKHDKKRPWITSKNKI